MLEDFLRQNARTILALTEKKTRELAGAHPTSDELQKGLPRFYGQIIEVIGSAGSPQAPPAKDVGAIAKAADRGDEPAMAEAAGLPQEAELARTAGRHGAEMLRLGYTLSHVVHAYGAMCQAITETAAEKDSSIDATEFHALNRCLDVAIAGAVTDFQSRKDSEEPGPTSRDLATQMRSTIVRTRAGFEAIQKGAVGTGGITAQAVERGLGQLEQLIDQVLAASDAARPASHN